MAKRRKKQDNDHIDESWLLPYSDLLTLLLALFIVLFAASSIDAQKFQVVSQVFNSAFTTFEGGSGVMEQPEIVPSTAEMESSMSRSEMAVLEKEEKEELTEIHGKMQDYIQENHLQDKVETVLSGEGLLLRIHDNVLFDSGISEIRKEDEQAAREISRLLEMEVPRAVVISGHTDNVPIKTQEFDSNWELSAMRAVNFMKVVLENKKLDPRLFSAKGYGEYQPIASNETAEGRSKNRRVEILVLPQGTEENSLHTPASIAEPS
ncbi:flagellar motor protein MotB [Bacillus thermotolerans]|uniref:Flagellar motor rotation protein MotB n=1 Tax=Bacillus thermotolerans TaxID=1221996 RepID=A0A0F5I4G5_BACTR|nr:flagellar motor protein MotB [Bacillus thermotolerans]KKB40373.1 Flagellar motor rotation protein MotB [Bacillus thermotolerans]